jgi:5-oxoprolinase (ATP-hydrolysing) subunit A
MRDSRAAPHPATIDINADLGEGCGHDTALLGLVTSASVSCGAHAGDEAAIIATLREAVARGVAVGSHPGYPDRESFGRRERSMSPADVTLLIHEQHRYLEGLAGKCGVVPRFVKPHGALYNQAQKEPVVALAVALAVHNLGLPVLGQRGGAIEVAAKELGVRFVSEGFPDRRYEPDSRLVPRSRFDAVLHDPVEVEDQIVRLVALGMETLCVHGGDPDAVRNAMSVRRVLERHGVEPRFWL